jgi:hypothetical protein
MSKPLMGRQIKITTNLRCDFDHSIIPVGRVGYQITQGKAQGMYHGKLCYEAALKKYEELEKQNGLGGEDDE